ncbi:MAG TPA: hypothetical protein VKZ79_03895 [Alphaproteobacteria bacterium]|nr:hypothetical protein [Alphaproteobacteria bacterium]
MAPYQVLLVDRNNYTFAIEEIEGDDDAEAIAKASKIHVPSFGAAFEIWQGDRFVCGGPCHANGDRDQGHRGITSPLASSVG